MKRVTARNVGKGTPVLPSTENGGLKPGWSWLDELNWRIPPTNACKDKQADPPEADELD